MDTSIHELVTLEWMPAGTIEHEHWSYAQFIYSGKTEEDQSQVWAAKQ